MVKKALASSIRGGGKKEQILAAADQLFMQKGYTHVSMDEIAHATPVSKPTLYSHFADKAALFEAVITYRCNYFLQDLTATLDPAQFEKSLQRFGEVYVAMLTSKQAIMTHRSIIAEQGHFPAIGQLFYDNGPRRSRELITGFFTTAQKKNKLGGAVAPELLADMFMSTLKGYMHLEVLLGLKAPPSAAAIKTRVQQVVNAFMQFAK